MDQLFLEIVWRNRGLGNFTQSHNRILVIVAVDGDRRARRNGPRAVTREKHEVEAIFNLVDAVLNGDTGHLALLLLRTLRCCLRSGVGYALIAFYEAPIPGIGHWDKIILTPMLWHFNFRGPDMERLVAGRERIYLDRFYNELSADPKKIDEATRNHYAALYARPRAMHDAFAQFNAIRRDAEDNQAAMATKLAMPVLAIGGEKSFGPNEAIVMRNAATNVTELVVPNAGHWLMEEAPDQVIPKLVEFLDR